MENNYLEKLELLKEAIHPSLWDNGAYRFFDLTIILKGTSTIETLTLEKENASCFTTLIHEYVHFIQNFTTLHGFTNFITYVDLVLAFFARNSNLKDDPSIPTKNGIVDISFGHKNLENYMTAAFLGSKKKGARFVFESTNEDSYKIIESKIVNPYWQKDVFISYITYYGDLIPLNTLVASENMAIVSSYLSSGLSLAEAEKTINTEWEPQYHIIYSFLKNLFPESNCFKLTYKISEISLLIGPFNETIFNILKYLEDNKSKFEKLDEHQIIEFIKDKIQFKKNLEDSIEKANNLLDKRISIYSKHEQDNEFFTHLIKILTLFKKGLSERATKPFTYRDNFNSSFLEYYSNIIKSPILVFPNNKKTMLGKPSEDFVNSIAIVSGVLTVFNQTYLNTFTKCPFANDHSLCEATKGAECKSDPLAIYSKVEYKGCLLHNALDIIGLKKEGRNQIESNNN